MLRMLLIVVPYGLIILLSCVLVCARLLLVRLVTRQLRYAHLSVLMVIMLMITRGSVLLAVPQIMGSMIPLLTTKQIFVRRSAQSKMLMEIRKQQKDIV